MLLASLFQQQQDNYAQIQVQIELLQDKQREIQANLQKLGSVESKMLAAAQLLQEAITAIDETCPSELGNYRETVLSLFEKNAPVLIEPSVPVAENVTSSDTDCVSPPEDIESSSGTEPSPDNSAVPVDVIDDITSTPEDLITVDSLLESIKFLIASAPYNNLKNICADYKLSTKGKQTELRNRFLEYCIDSDFMRLHGIVEYLSNAIDVSQAAA